MIFYTIGSPSETIRESLENNETNLLGIESTVIKDICRKYPFFRPVEIPFSDYHPYCSQNLHTIAVKSVCVTRVDVDAQKVNAVFQALKHISEEPDSMVKFDHRSITDGLTIALHPVIEEYIRSRSTAIGALINKILHYLVPFLLIVCIPVFLYFTPRIIHIIHQFVLVRLFIFLIFTWWVGSTLMFVIEGNKNESFSTFGKSSVAILYYLFSGFEAKYPVTNLGNIVSIGIISFGVALITLFTGTIVTVLIEQSLGIRHLRKKPSFLFSLKNHVILTGWSDRSKRIIKELRKPDIVHKPSIVVITDNVRNTTIHEKKKYRDVWVVEGDYTKPSVLLRSGIQNAGTVLMLSLNPRDPDSDLKTVLTGTEIAKINPDTHIISEALTFNSYDQMKKADINEIITIREYTSKFIAQSIISPGIMDFYNEVIEFGSDSQEFYVSDIPAEFADLSFRSIQRYLLHHSEVTPVGYCTSTGDRYVWMLNPRLNSNGFPDQDSIISRNTDGHDIIKLVCLADEQPIFEKILKKNTSNSAQYIQDKKIIRLSSDSCEKEKMEMSTSYIGICHWNSKAESIIRELQSSVLSKHHEYHITVLLNHDEKADTPKIPGGLYKNVKYYYGYTTSHDVLESMGIKQMDTFLILAQEDESVYTDYKTLIIAQTARRLSPDLHIVVEVLNSDNLEHFHRMDSFEIISVSDITEKLMAQATVTHGLTQLYSELLTATADSNEVYIIPVPGTLVGKTYSDVARMYIDSDNDIILLGYRIKPDDTGKPVMVINPRLKSDDDTCSRHYRLRETDSLIIMAYEEP